MVERPAIAVFEKAMHVLEVKRVIREASGSEMTRNDEETKRTGRISLGGRRG